MVQPTTPLPSRRIKPTPSNLRRSENTPVIQRVERPVSNLHMATPLGDNSNMDMNLEAVTKKIRLLEAELARERVEKATLAKDLADAQVEAMTRDVFDGADLRDQLAAVEGELEEERKRTEDLERQVQEQLRLADERIAEERAERLENGSILRPKGTAGQHWSIQEAMGLGGSARKHESYHMIQRQLRDLAISAQLNWEVEWSQIPTVDKAKFFLVAREKIQFLKRFHNDWATEEIVKQYFKNKRKNHYRHGWLEVPDKYKHLSETSAKRNPSASRVKRVKSAMEAAKKQKKRRLHKRTEVNGEGNEDVDMSFEDDDVDM
ncbi:hypothetical protein H0H93_016417, partial [Arthromyces matolae]